MRAPASASSSTISSSRVCGSTRRRMTISRCSRMRCATSPERSATSSPIRRRPAVVGASGSSSAPPSRSFSRNSAAFDPAGSAATGGRERGRGARGLAHRHARRHRACRRVRVMSRREASAGNEHALDPAGQQRAIRDAVYAATRNVAPLGVAAGMVVLDRRAAQRHFVVEAARRQHVVAGELVVTDHAAALAHADRRARADHD